MSTGRRGVGRPAAVASGDGAATRRRGLLRGLMRLAGLVGVVRAVGLGAGAGAAWAAADAAADGRPGAAASPPADATSPWPVQRLAPGGVARVALGPSPQRPQAWLGDVPLLVLGSPAGWTALAGLALSTPPGALALRLRREDQAAEQTLSITVGPQAYAEQRLSVAPRHVDLSPDDRARADREREHLAALMARQTSPWPERLAMQAPVPGLRSSSFGLRRVFNGQPRAPHSGMDIAAAAGTLVRAPLAGRVADVGDYFFAGRSVWIDHGGGLLSLLAHLSEASVAPGDAVAAGDPVGRVGATGRVTGAHLHWGVSLNGAMVDPALFLAGVRARGLQMDESGRTRQAPALPAAARK